MTYLRAAAFALLLCVGTATAEELTGLWKAKGRFGPDARGVLILQKDGTHYFADMLGRRVPVRAEAGEPTAVEVRACLIASPPHRRRLPETARRAAPWFEGCGRTGPATWRGG